MIPWDGRVLHLGQARCAGCGLLAAQPQATAEELAAYYGGRYYEQHTLDDEAHWQINVRDYPRYELPLMERLWARSPPPRGALIGEIGAGRGALLSVLAGRGYRVRGAELSASAAAFCRSKGLDVIAAADFTDAAAPADGAFDVAISFQVIEHVTDPRAFVRRMVEMVKPGGLVVLTTESAWTAQSAFVRARSFLTGHIPPYRTSTEHTFVFQGRHLERLLREEGCDDAGSATYQRGPATGSLHFRLYQDAFRLLDRWTRHEPYLMAVGHRGPA